MLIFLSLKVFNSDTSFMHFPGLGMRKSLLQRNRAVKNNQFCIESHLHLQSFLRDLIIKDNDSGSGVIVYDDLNQPHLVEPEPQEQHFPFKEQLNNTSLDFKSSLELRNDVLDPKHDSIMAKYNVQNTLYHHTSLSTFTRWVKSTFQKEKFIWKHLKVVFW